jgi:hypothetical protein
MNSFRKQNPLVLCQILENQAFLVSNRVSLWKCSVELSGSKWHSGDLGMLRWRRYQGEVHFAYKDATGPTPAQTESLAEFRPSDTKEAGSRASRKSSRDWRRVSALSSKRYWTRCVQHERDARARSVWKSAERASSTKARPASVSSTTPSCVASEQVQSMLCFEVGNLFTERRLGYVQSVRGPS